ncbi:MAG: PCRF domain-containing protein [Candidatus Paceibacterota bacterium]
MDEKNKKNIELEIKKIETEMSQADFWNDKQKAQERIKKMEELKMQMEGVGKYDKGNAVITIFSGAGGDDSEDFSRMLLEMYLKFSQKKGWGTKIINKNENDNGDYRNITFEIQGKNAYGTLKNESGVHRLVRISPFNANGKRQTSFSMVEVVPEIQKTSEVDMKDEELDISFTRSGGPGGQNVNKRETAVRIVHIPTKISVHADSERSQEHNKQKALEILAGKLYYFREAERKRKEEGLSVSKTTENEWGSQIRSYVLHPYKLVKDHRTSVEIRDVEKVLNGDIDEFIEAEKNL